MLTPLSRLLTWMKDADRQIPNKTGSRSSAPGWAFSNDSQNCAELSGIRWCASFGKKAPRFQTCVVQIVTIKSSAQEDDLRVGMASGGSSAARVRWLSDQEKTGINYRRRTNSKTLK